MTVAPPERLRLSIPAAFWVAAFPLLSGCQSEAGKGWYRTDGAAAGAEELSIAQTICRGEVQKATLSGGRGPSVMGAIAEQDAFNGCMAARGLVLKEIR